MSVLDGNAELLALCEELGLGSLVRGPLGMGVLTGKYTPTSTFPADDVRHVAQWHPALRDGRPTQEWLDRLASIRDVLGSDGRTLAQGALAWLWARSPNTVPIPGFRTVQQVEENCGALASGPLTATQMAEIDHLLSTAEPDRRGRRTAVLGPDRLDTTGGGRMALGPVLVIGLDPVRIAGWDPEPVVAAIVRGQARFGEHGIEADLCLVAPEENAEAAIVEALTRKHYVCVVVGGGLRKHEPLLEFFETVVNLVRRHAPGAAIAFNNTPEDTADTALRWLR